MPHRKGSFQEDWNDLLIRFAQRRRNEQPRGDMLEQAQDEALNSDLCEPFDPHQALLERAQSSRSASTSREFS